MTKTERSWPKICASCGKPGYEEDFYTTTHSKGKQVGLHRVYSSCKSCISMDRRAKAYGVSVEVIRDMLSGASCGICGSDGQTNQKGLHIDHCHGSGKIRGVLCHYCNTGLGAFNDDPNRLRRAMEYLK